MTLASFNASCLNPDKKTDVAIGVLVAPVKLRTEPDVFEMLIPAVPKVVGPPVAPVGPISPA